MEKHSISFDFEVFSGWEDLSPEDQMLISASIEASKLAYAPYSKFQVGAAALLDDGTVVKGSNKENASFPAGICAERNVLHSVSDRFPHKSIVALAITAIAENITMDGPLAPCGICRQVMCETEQVQQVPMRLLLASSAGNVYKMKSASDLLPFHFYLPELKK